MYRSRLYEIEVGEDENCHLICHSKDFEALFRQQINTGGKQDLDLDLGQI